MVQRKNKKTAYRRDESTKPITNNQSSLNVLQGISLVLLAATIVSLISLISFFFHSPEQNLLGVWVGRYWSELLVSLFGKILTVVFLLLLLVIGVIICMEIKFRRKKRIICSTLIIFESLCMLFSIPATLSGQRSFVNDGLFGIFLNSSLLKPIFGESFFGYYLITIFLLLTVFVLGFKIPIIKIFSFFIKLLGKLVIVFFHIFSIFFFKWRQIKKPKEQKYKPQKERKELIIKNQEKQSLNKEKNDSLDDVTIKKLAEKIDWSNPLEVRRYRDKEAELRRIKELNQWEVEERQPTFAGTIVKSPTNINKPKEVDKISQEKENSNSIGIPQPALTDNKTGNQYDTYKVIDLSQVLKDPPKQEMSYSEGKLKEQAAILEEQLANFKVMGKVVEICTGPVIVCYEIELAPGVKVSRVAGLADDLALSLKAKRIRILAPIPGKSVVGIEVPSLNPQIVYAKDVLCSSKFTHHKDNLEVALGKSRSGESVVIDLAKAPHLLIAGQTGSGKSVCINALMVSILGSKTPDQVRMILIDPKVVELKPYDKVPHLLAPVIHKPEIAIQALQWTTYEMDRRYEILSKVGARNIIGFNQKFKDGLVGNLVDEADSKHMPYIIVVIDELADLMMVAGKDVETSVARIAQKARAVGIHLIVATQRPSTNVITGTIKANLPTRIAFQVASYIDSRTIIDKSGAEKLLGRGDMLFRSIESPEVERVHGAFVDDQEAEDVAHACSKQFVNYPQIETFDLSSVPGEHNEMDIPRDSKFRDAAELVCSLKQGSASLLQRKMSIGYARAGRLIDQLEAAGIVGPDRGSKPRIVLMDELTLQSFLSSGLNDS